MAAPSLVGSGPARAIPPNAFIGRESELAQIRTLLKEGRRLVTVWGAGGIGKTRLALELACEIERAGRRVLFVDLTSVHGAEGICAALALAMDIALGHGEASDTAEHIGRALAALHAPLIVIDNFESHVDAGPTTIAPWLRLAPNAQFLVTSRQRLRLVGEVTYEVPPLSAANESVRASDMGRLFEERVREFRPGFALSEAQDAELSTFFARLDGLPLAVELAAARFDVLGLHGLIQRLSKKLDVLQGHKLDDASRQATLSNTIEWSWDLLGEIEQRVLAQCAVFSGGFSLAAAEGVVDVPADTSVLDVLQSLRDKSLLRSDPIDGEPRFSLLSCISEFSATRIDNDDTKARHAEFYASASRGWADGFERRGDPESLSNLVIDRDNLLAVIERKNEVDAELALECAVGLEPLLSAKGPVSDHMERLNETLGAVRESETSDASLLARALRARGRLELLAGKAEPAKADFDEAIEIAKSTGDRAIEAVLWLDVGVVHHQKRELDEARSCYERAREVERRPAPRLEGRIFGNLGAIQHDQRNLEGAAEHYRKALRKIREAGDRRLEGIFRANLALLEQERGRLAESKVHFDRALALLSKVGDRRFEAITWTNLGSLYHELGDFPQAELHHRNALDALRQIGERRSEGLTRARLGAIRAEQGHLDDARAELDAAESILDDIEDRVSLEVVGLNRGFVDLCEHIRSQSTKSESGADGSPHLERLRTRIDRVQTPQSPTSRALAEISDDICTTLRILQKTLANIDEAVVEGAAATGEFPDDALIIGPEATWFRAPKDRFHDFSRRQAPRRFLAAFVGAHVSDAALTLDRLIEVGWPGEVIRQSAAENRVWVTLATLRKLGLKAHLQKSEAGYRLDAALEIVRSTETYREVLERAPEA